MGNPNHLAILNQGARVWNRWRHANPSITPDLSNTQIPDVRALVKYNLSDVNLSNSDLSGLIFRETDLRRADLSRARLWNTVFFETDFSGARLPEADLSDGLFWGGATFDGTDLFRTNFQKKKFGSGFTIGNSIGRGPIDFGGARLVEADFRQTTLENVIFANADLSKSDFSHTSFPGVDFSRAVFRGANFSGSDLRDATFRDSDLSGADLTFALLVNTDFEGANLDGCKVYGASTWGVRLKNARQTDLIITPTNAAAITVDYLEVAQFIFLLLNNEKIRSVINTITSKAVLILGRFTDERKAILEILRDELRKRNFLPIVFDFAPPDGRDVTETVTLLARISRFIIADITDPRSVPKELEAIIPVLAVPVQPLIHGSEQPYSMFTDYWKYDWVLQPCRYQGSEDLISSLDRNVIANAEAKAIELNQKRSGNSS